MAYTVTPGVSSLNITIVSEESVTGGAQAVTDPLRLQYESRLVNGTGSGKVNRARLNESITIAPSGNKTYDLTSFTDDRGNSVTTAAKLRRLVIHNTGTVNVEVGAGGANSFVGAGFLKDISDVFTVVGGQMVVVEVAAGITIDATHKDLKILNVSGATSATCLVYAEVATA